MKINKVSKKIIIMLSGIFLVSTNISAAENEDVLLQSIFNAHAVVFGVENVFSQ
ncbi:MAG: hypothetical protein WCD44_02660 [Candidatus Babeliales bacterium]